MLSTGQSVETTYGTSGEVSPFRGNLPCPASGAAPPMNELEGKWIARLLAGISADDGRACLADQPRLARILAGLSKSLPSAAASARTL